MRSADLKNRMQERPFRPFSIRLTDGTVHVIRHPEGAIVTPHNIVVGIPRSPDSPAGEYQDYALVTLLHIIQIDPISSLPAASVNGETTFE